SGPGGWRVARGRTRSARRRPRGRRCYDASFDRSSFATREPIGERSRETRLAHLGLRFVDGVWNAAEVRKPPVEIQQEPRGPRIAVTRLAHGARVQQPPPLQLELDAFGRDATGNPAVRKGQRQRDVA